MSTIETIAQAIADNFQNDAAYVASILRGEDSEVEFYQELHNLAEATETPTEVLRAIEYYCAENKDQDATADALYFIGAEATATISLKEYGVRSATIMEQVDRLDWELPNLPEYEDSDDFREAVVKAFEAHNQVSLEAKAREYFLGGLDDFYNPEV